MTIFIYDHYGLKHPIALDAPVHHIYVMVVGGGERITIAYEHGAVEDCSNLEDDLLGKYDGGYLVRPNQFEIWNKRTSPQQWLKHYEWE